MIAASSQHDGGGEDDSVLTADAIAAAVGGRVVGNSATEVSSIAPLDRARGDQLSFFASGKYAALFAATAAGVVLIAPELANLAGSAPARVIVENPHEALLSLIPRFYRTPPRLPGIHHTAAVGRGVLFGPGVCVGPYAVIGDRATIGVGAVIDAHCVIGAGAVIGDGCHLCPGVTLYAGTCLGRRVILHSGVRAGSDGFGYVFHGGQHEKIPHVGRCIIEDDVEIGANSTVDRGSIGDTVVGAGTKIDNLVQIAHNVRIGRLCLIMAQVGLAGSVHVEDGCVIAGQVGVAGHTSIGAGARLGGQSGAFGDVPAGETWSGYPARPHKEALRAQAALFKLPALLRRIERMLDAAGKTS